MSESTKSVHLGKVGDATNLSVSINLLSANLLPFLVTI